MSGELKACVEQADRDAAEQWRFIEGRYSEYEGDFVADLAADFARHRRAPAWEGIESAPRDGTPLLLACATWPHSTVLGKPVPIKVGGWDTEGRQWDIFGASWIPTHWQPLPAAPADGGK